MLALPYEVSLLLFYKSKLVENFLKKRILLEIIGKKCVKGILE